MKLMNSQKKIIIAIILITAFVFGVSFSTLYAQTNILGGTAYTCTLPIPLLIPTLSSLGVFVGSLVYYLMFSRMERVDKKIIKDANILLDILPPEEKEIIKKIVENKGSITQSKLSSIYGKVKTFRILESLKRRRIIEKESYGKTNKIKLNEKYKEILCS